MFKKLAAIGIIIACNLACAQDPSPQQAAGASNTQGVNPTLGAPDGLDSVALMLQTQGKTLARLDILERDLRDARSESEEAIARSIELQGYLVLLAALAAIFFITIVAHTRRELSRQASRLTASHSEEIRATLAEESKNQLAKLSDKLHEETSRSVKSMEDRHFQYMQITSLRHSRQYDDALTYVSWRGDYSPFRQYPNPIQRSLIACLCNSRSARQSKEHLLAWDWSRELVREDPSVDNVIALIKTGNTLKHWNDAIEVYDQVSPDLNEDERRRCEPYLFVSLRRSSDSEHREQYSRRLKKIADSRKGSQDIKFITTLAAFYRDQGRFQDAEMVMNPHIRRLTGSSHLEEGWDKLFNTYLANCIDQGKPELGIDPARTMLTQNVTPDLIFNCARVAWRLQDNNPQRRYIIEVIRKRYADGYMAHKDDGTIKTLAILKEVDGDLEGSVSAVTNSIDEMASESGTWATYQRYYFQCMLAEIYIARGDKDSISKAITQLEGVVAGDRIGEAAYLMAKAYAIRGEHGLLRRYLGAAGGIQRKWVMKARNDEAFRNFPALDELLSDYVGV